MAPNSLCTSAEAAVLQMGPGTPRAGHPVLCAGPGLSSLPVDWPSTLRYCRRTPRTARRDGETSHPKPTRGDLKPGRLCMLGTSLHPLWEALWPRPCDKILAVIVRGNKIFIVL